MKSKLHASNYLLLLMPPMKRCDVKVSSKGLQTIQTAEQVSRPKSDVSYIEPFIRVFSLLNAILPP
jgi:hypothetical protein